jgi:CRISPR-associated protein Csx14
MPEYRIEIEPRNPGQYLACCGLLELADLAAPGAEARFDERGTTFLLRTDATSPPRDLALLAPESWDGKPYDEALEPLTLACEGGPFALNWWLNQTLTEKSALKTWGGQQTPRRVLGELLRLLDHSKSFECLFEASAYTKSRFGVDARSAWDALDAGYSPNDLGQAALTFPWVEVLSVIGLQGFRPAPQGRARYRYSAWRTNLPVSAARAACACPWPGLPVSSYEFSVALRGQGYKTFLFGEEN